jgi:hypothetical protein
MVNTIGNYDAFRHTIPPETINHFIDMFSLKNVEEERQNMQYSTVWEMLKGRSKRSDCGYQPLVVRATLPCKERKNYCKQK